MGVTLQVVDQMRAALPEDRRHEFEQQFRHMDQWMGNFALSFGAPAPEFEEDVTMGDPDLQKQRRPPG